MPSTTVTGLASGIQWQDTIDQLMQLERRPVDILESRKAEYQAKSSAWTQLESLLSTLQSTSEGMDELTELVSKSASSSDTDFLSVSAEASAISGTHTVEINQLAQNEIRVHDTGWPDLNTTSITQTGNTFQYTFEGLTRTITLNNGATMLDLVQAINNHENNIDDPDGDIPRITASTLDDGSASNSIHLVMTADESTSANSLTIDDGVGETDIGTATIDFDDTDFVNTQDAQNSEFRVDGYPTAGWISRDSNIIDDVLEGLTFTLKDADAGATSVTVGVANDYVSTKAKINDWVDAYNDIMQFISDTTSYDAENEVMGILMNDSQVRTVRDQLISIVANEIPGADESTQYTSFAMAGLDLSDGSKIKIDDSDLQDALEDDVEAVANMFVFSHSTTDSAIDFFTKTDATMGGEYAVSATYLASGKLDDTASNTIGGYAATVVDDYYLLGPDDSPIEGLRLRFESPGGAGGTINATVRIGTGAAVMADHKVGVLTDSIDGLFTSVKDGFESQIDHIDEQIESYEERLEIKRQTLEAQYLAMEQAVSEANATSSYLSSL